MTPENRILLERIFSEISYKDHDNLIAENDVLKSCNTELKAENERLIAKVEKVEQERDDYFTRLKTLAWNTQSKSEENPTSLELSKIILALSEQIRDLKADSEKWYKAFNNSQETCLDYATLNRKLREQLYGVGKVTAV